MQGVGRMHIHPQRRMLGWFHVVSGLLLVLKRTMTPTRLKAGALLKVSICGVLQWALDTSLQGIRGSWVWLGSGNLHKADREDKNHPDLSPGRGLEVPHRMYRHEKDDQVGQGVANPTCVQ